MILRLKRSAPRKRSGLLKGQKSTREALEGVSRRIQLRFRGGRGLGRKMEFGRKRDVERRVQRAREIIWHRSVVRIIRHVGEERIIVVAAGARMAHT